MGKDHILKPGAELPDDTIIWRYMTYATFARMLFGHSIFFRRACKFTDPWEGRFPPSFFRNSDQDIETLEHFERIIRGHRYAHFYSCWHMSDCESDAMWKGYCLGTEGIAVQSTVGRIRDCVTIDGGGPVIYFDPAANVRTEGVFAVDYGLFKRNCFAHEREYRVKVVDDDLFESIQRGERPDERNLTDGIDRGISDIQHLITAIVVAPGSKRWFRDLVENTCAQINRRTLCPLIRRSSTDESWEDHAFRWPVSVIEDMQAPD
ncbi:MAG TPA: hypothetical protein VKS79_22015 [Gemmataceae bacterium]|nr:hypothetical protein [Gemmataceae bacterium]